MKPTHTSAQFSGIVALTAAAFVYAGIGILSKFVGYGLPLFYQNWTRSAVGYLFFGEIPSPFVAIGGAIIVISMMLPEINWAALHTRIYDHRR